MYRVVNVGAPGWTRSPRRLGQFPQVTLPSAEGLDPADFEPEKAEPIAVSEGEAEAARKEYLRSVRSLEGVEGWARGIRPANWEEIARLARDYAFNETTIVKRTVRGRTGNPDAEYELEARWWGLWQRAANMLMRPPSWFAQALDKASLFVSDFVKGAQEAWQGYSTWVLERSGPVLERYHAAAKRLVELKDDLEGARASGQYTPGQLEEQRTRIEGAESAVDAVRTAFSVLSAGASIDEVAQERLGRYKMGLAGWFLVAAKLILLLALIMTAYHAVMGVKRLSEYVFGREEDRGEQGPGIIVWGGVALVAAVGVYHLFLKD